MRNASPTLYNVRVLHGNHDTVAICEGELDAITATEYGGVPAIGIPGAATWRPIYREILSGPRRILVVGDGDDAGRAFSERICGELDNAVPITVPDELDVNKYFCRYGGPRLARLLRERKDR